mgnify:FL=1
MKFKYISGLIASLTVLSLQSLLYAQAKHQPTAKPKLNPASAKSTVREKAPTFDPELYKLIKMLSPEESIAKIKLPEGYSLEPVLTEPYITEPVACVFDGNGRMYVVEMNTYMQDADATGEFEHTSRISMHEDTNGDGKYDKHSVFIDNLLLPRMVLPLEDSIVVGITNTLDLFLYKDTDGDGVADKKSLYYKGGPRGGNMEHQPSGLIWSMDNWAYTTYTPKRYKMGPEKLIKTEITGINQGQWGLTQDNYGKPWFVNAGGEVGPVNYQHPIVYGMSRHFKNQEEPGFKKVFPICPQLDVQGGPRRLKPLKGGEGMVLNHFTATCGQDIFRGDRLPADLQGDLLFAEPVGRLIRRTKVEVKDGVTFLRNACPESEFIRSTDPNFRPVNMVTAPDGTLYIVDMYRGIIQEGNWTRPKSYLRSIIDKYGFDKNIQHGRIYRLVHKDHKRGPKPNMIRASSEELVKHLSHPNGWWRDTAQKILVLRGDKSVVDKLTVLAKGDAQGENHLAQIHALWTLEGTGALKVGHIETALKDKHPQVRRAAIRTAESLIKDKDASSETLITAITNQLTDPDPEVAMQVILSAQHLKLKNRQEILDKAETEIKSIGVQQTLNGFVKLGSLNHLTKDQRIQHKRGKVIYRQLCSSCHGENGKGVKAGGTMMAPPLAGSASVNGHRDQFINIVLHGLEGPVNGKNYTAPMVSMKSQSDQWIADVVSYIRNDLGNRASFVSKEDVAAVRKETKNRTTPWTLVELSKIVPKALETKQWKVTASHNNKAAKFAIDGNKKKRYTSGTQQKPGMWYQIEFPEAVELKTVRLDTAGSPNDFPAEYIAEISNDGKIWQTVQKAIKGDYFITEINCDAKKAKFFRITTKAGNKRNYWSIHDIKAYVN